MTEQASRKTAALVAARNFTSEVSSWRRLCQDALTAMSAQHQQEDGIHVDPKSVFAQDFLYISTERELVSALRGQSIEALEKFQRLNRDLLPRVLDGKVDVEQLLPALKTYHHFFDQVAGLEALVTRRHRALTDHCVEGDRICATFDTDGLYQIRRFRRIFLTRKRLFLDDLLVQWQIGFATPDNHDWTVQHWANSPLQGGLGGLGEELLPSPPTWLVRIRRFVSDHMDYDHDWMKDTLRRAHASAPPLLKAPSTSETTLSRYRDALKTIKGVDEELEKLLKAAGKFERLSPDQLDKFNELQAKRMLNQQVADVSAKQMPLLSTVGKNIADFKMGEAAIQSGLLIAQSSALAALDGLNKGVSGYGHRVNWTEIGNEALIDLAQVGGLVVVSLLFGPSAGAGAASIVGLLFRGKAPDPHEERYKALNQKLDRVLDRISALEDSVMARLNAIPGQIRSVVVEERFRAAVAALSDRFSNIQRRHEEVFSGRRSHLYGVDLHEEIQAMRDNLQGLVRALWCDDFVLDLKIVSEQSQLRAEEDTIPVVVPTRQGEAPPPRPTRLRPSAGSVITTLIRGANQEGHAQRFEYTIGAIHELATMISELGSAYGRAIDYVVSSLGASLVLPGGQYTAAALVQACEVERLVDEDIRVLLWVSSEILLSPGKRNVELYQRLAPCREDWRNLDPFRGFELIGESGRWCYRTEPGGDNDSSHVVHWYSGKHQGLNQGPGEHMLFIVPDGGSADKPYTFVTQDQKRLTATAQLALGTDDTLTLHIGKKGIRVHYDPDYGIPKYRRSNYDVGDVYQAVDFSSFIRIGNSSIYGQESNESKIKISGSDLLVLKVDHKKLCAKIEVHINTYPKGYKVGNKVISDEVNHYKVIPLADFDLNSTKLKSTYDAGTLCWTFGRQKTEQGRHTGPAFVGVGVFISPDKNHPDGSVEPLEVFSLNSSRALNFVEAEAAFDIEVSFQVDGKSVSVLLDNLTPFRPKSYLLRGQSLPVGGYLVDKLGKLFLFTQRDRHLVVYQQSENRETDIPELKVLWASGSWEKNSADGCMLQLTSEGALVQKTANYKIWWSAAQYDTKRGSKWSEFKNGEATRLVFDDHRARLLNSKGQDCFVFHEQDAKAVKKLSDVA